MPILTYSHIFNICHIAVCIMNFFISTWFQFSKHQIKLYHPLLYLTFTNKYHLKNTYFLNIYFSNTFVYFYLKLYNIHNNLKWKTRNGPDTEVKLHARFYIIYIFFIPLLINRILANFIFLESFVMSNYYYVWIYLYVCVFTETILKINTIRRRDVELYVFAIEKL